MSGSLIISPLNVKFQAPFPRLQRRQLSLLNVSAKPIHYSVFVDAPQLLEVQPQRGVIGDFDTIELCILLQPVAENQPNCSFLIRHLVDDYPERMTDWTQARITLVSITLEDMLQYNKRLHEMFEQEANDNEHQRVELEQTDRRQLCRRCALRRMGMMPEKRSRLQSILRAARVLLLPLVAYCGWNWRDLVGACSTNVINY